MQSLDSREKHSAKLRVRLRVADHHNYVTYVTVLKVKLTSIIITLF